MLDRVMTWRFAVLVGVLLVDAAVFMVPLCAGHTGAVQ
jgi:hypothetical protein